jgi:hypothetical protein
MEERLISNQLSQNKPAATSHLQLLLQGKFQITVRIDQAIKALDLTKELGDMPQWVTMTISMETENETLVIIEETHLTAPETAAETEETIVTIESTETIEVALQEETTIDTVVTEKKPEEDIDLTRMIQMGQAAHTTEVKIEESRTATVTEEDHTTAIKASLSTIRNKIETREKDQSLIDELIMFYL